MKKNMKIWLTKTLDHLPETNNNSDRRDKLQKILAKFCLNYDLCVVDAVWKK